MQTHEATEQGLEHRQAVHSQTASEPVSDGAAALDNSLQINLSTQAAGRRYPRARNQIVRAVKAHDQAVPEATGDGSAAVLELSLEEAAALVASRRRFPRARNPIVNAVKASKLAFVAGQAVRVEKTAAADETKSGDVSKPASRASPRVNLIKVRQRHDNHLIIKAIVIFGLGS